MYPYDMDHRSRLRLAREHADELRADWRMANGRGRHWATKPAKPCGMSVVEYIRRAAARLAELGRRPTLVREDPCS